MPIAPITGMLRKRFWLDITTGLGLGLSAGAAFWSVIVVSPRELYSHFITGTATS